MLLGRRLLLLSLHLSVPLGHFLLFSLEHVLLLETGLLLSWWLAVLGAFSLLPSHFFLHLHSLVLQSLQIKSFFFKGVPLLLGRLWLGRYLLLLLLHLLVFLLLLSLHHHLLCLLLGQGGLVCHVLERLLELNLLPLALVNSGLLNRLASSLKRLLISLHAF